jgi:hypothetical protein
MILKRAVAGLKMVSLLKSPSVFGQMHDFLDPQLPFRG